MNYSWALNITLPTEAGTSLGHGTNEPKHRCARNRAVTAYNAICQIRRVNRPHHVSPLRDTLNYSYSLRSSRCLGLTSPEQPFLNRLLSPREFICRG